MKVLVCDDSQEDLDRVAALLAEPCRNIRAQLTAASRPEELGDLSCFDLAFLDIDMKGTDGLTLARRLRAARPDAVIVFVTNFVQYAPEGYEVQALPLFSGYRFRWRTRSITPGAGNGKGAQRLFSRTARLCVACVGRIQQQKRAAHRQTVPRLHCPVVASGLDVGCIIPAFSHKCKRFSSKALSLFFPQIFTGV